MSAQLPLSFDKAAEARDAGMKAATDHADRDSPTWSDRALAFIHQYAIEHADLTIEDVRFFAHKRGLPMPPDGRAWGSMPRAAAFRKWIKKTDRVRDAQDPKVHKNRCQVWESLLYVGPR